MAGSDLMLGTVLPWLYAGVTVVLMAVALFGILKRLWALLRGRGEQPLPAARPVGKKALLWVALLALGSRGLLYVVSWLMLCAQAHAWQPFFGNLPRLWIQWDAYHYLSLSEIWYVNEGDNRYMLVFFPLFPLLLRGLRAVFQDGFFPSLALNCGCTMGAACLLYALVGERYGHRRGQLAVLYLLLNPLSVFLGAPYSEALFLLLTLGALYACAHRRYGWAALCGALSAATRMLGLVVCGVILLTALQHAWREQSTWRGRLKQLAWPLCCAAFVGVGFGAYLLLNISVSGAPFTFLRYQEEVWSQRFGSFWNTARVSFDYVLRGTDTADFWGTWLPQVVVLPLVMALLAARQKRQPLVWAAYSWAYLFIALAPTWLLSGPRYIMAMPTLYPLQALAGERRWGHALALTAQAVLLLAATYVYGIARGLL